MNRITRNDWTLQRFQKTLSVRHFVKKISASIRQTPCALIACDHSFLRLCALNVWIPVTVISGPADKSQSWRVWGWPNASDIFFTKWRTDKVFCKRFKLQQTALAAIC